jgi:hypothetical protein
VVRIGSAAPLFAVRYDSSGAKPMLAMRFTRWTLADGSIIGIRDWLGASA